MCDCVYNYECVYTRAHAYCTPKTGNLPPSTCLPHFLKEREKKDKKREKKTQKKKLLYLQKQELTVSSYATEKTIVDYPMTFSV